MVGVGLECVGTPAAYLGAFFGTREGGNLGGIHDPQLDKLVADISAADNPQLRNQLLERLQEVIATNSYAMVLTHSADTFVVSPAYKDFQPISYLQYASAGLTPSG